MSSNDIAPIPAITKIAAITDIIIRLKKIRCQSVSVGLHYQIAEFYPPAARGAGWDDGIKINREVAIGHINPVFSGPVLIIHGNDHYIIPFYFGIINFYRLNFSERININDPAIAVSIDIKIICYSSVSRRAPG